MSKLLDWGDGFKAEHFYHVCSLFQITAITVVGSVAANVPACAGINAPEEGKLFVCMKLGEKLDLLEVPKKVIDRLKEFTAPVNDSIKNWSLECEYRYGLSRELALNPVVARHGGYRWKWCGTLDCTAMAKVVIGDDQLSLTGRFRVACEYCFRDDILMLYDQLGIEERQSILTTANEYQLGNNLLRYWICVLNDDIQSIVIGTDHRDEIELGFELANSSGMISSITCFWEKLGTDYKSERLIEFAKAGLQYTNLPSGHKDFEDILPFFLLKMTRDQQLQLLCNDDQFGQLPLLEVLLKWPYQDLFIPAFEEALSWIDDLPSLFDSALSMLHSNCCGDVVSDNILTIWGEFTEDFRQGVIFDYFWIYLDNFFKAKRRACLDVILDGVGSDKLKEIAFSEDSMGICCSMIREGNFDGVAEVVHHLVPKDSESLQSFGLMVFLNVSKESWQHSFGNNTYDEDVNLYTVRKRLSDFVTSYL